MSNILVINSGSTCIKYKLFNIYGNELSAGCIEHIANFDLALKKLLRLVINFGNISTVGHRIVHGGDKYFDPILLNDRIIKDLEKLNYLAPLHNPFNLAGVKSAINFLPEARQIAVFDTAFYKTLPMVAKTYALPKKIYEKNNIYRYGFHGISHEHALIEASKRLNKKPEKLNLITCHLGGGASVAAIKNGSPIDISNGFTPTEGLVMMTRTGDIDPGIIIELINVLPGKIDSKKINDVYNLINKESGLKGLSGVDDFKALLNKISSNDKSAILAFDIYIYKLSKYIGSYWVALNGKVDAIIFTGAIGNGNPITRNSIMKKIKFLNLPMFSIEANEELMIFNKIRRF